MSPQNNHLQRPPAAVLYAVELAKLKQNDNAPCPPGWQLSLPAGVEFYSNSFVGAPCCIISNLTSKL